MENVFTGSVSRTCWISSVPKNISVTLILSHRNLKKKHRFREKTLSVYTFPYFRRCEPLFFPLCRNSQTQARAASFLRFLNLSLSLSLSLSLTHTHSFSHTHTHTHNDTPQWVGLLWTKDRPIAETKHIHTRDRHYALGGIRTRNPSKRAAADARVSILQCWILPCIALRCHRN